jgi:hypothetical protein
VRRRKERGGAGRGGDFVHSSLAVQASVYRCAETWRAYWSSPVRHSATRASFSQQEPSRKKREQPPSPLHQHLTGCDSCGCAQHGTQEPACGEKRQHSLEEREAENGPATLLCPAHSSRFRLNSRRTVAACYIDCSIAVQPSSFEKSRSALFEREERAKRAVENVRERLLHRLLRRKGSTVRLECRRGRSGVQTCRVMRMLRKGKGMEGCRREGYRG